MESQDKFITNRTYQLCIESWLQNLRFFEGEWALQHNHPLLPSSRAKIHEKTKTSKRLAATFFWATKHLPLSVHYS